MTDHSNEIKEVKGILSVRKIFIRAIILIAALAGGAGFVLMVKGKSNDCSKQVAEGIKPFKEALSDVTHFMNNMKQDLAEDKSTGLILEEAQERSFAPAVFIEPDTTPVNKKRISKIDSLLKRIDSLNKKTKT